MDNENKDLDYYLNLNWTLIEGQDLDFDGNPYYYIEIKEIPSFTFCAKTLARARENYKRQLKLSLQVMLEMGEADKQGKSIDVSGFLTKNVNLE